MTKNTTALIKLHLAVFVAGLTGLFGKLVSLSEIPLVWYRCVLSILLFVIISVILQNWLMLKKNPQQ